jgi:hypothetical protein
MVSEVILYVYYKYLLQVFRKFVEPNKSCGFKMHFDTADSIIFVFSSGSNNHENQHSVLKMDLNSLKARVPFF